MLALSNWLCQKSDELFLGSVSLFRLRSGLLPRRFLMQPIQHQPSSGAWPPNPDFGPKKIADQHGAL